MAILRREFFFLQKAELGMRFLLRFALELSRSLARIDSLRYNRRRNLKEKEGQRQKGTHREEETETRERG
jgi:hypothetical protein